MWGDRFWPIRYFADRYFGTGADDTEPTCGLVQPIGDLTKTAEKVLDGTTDLTGQLNIVGHAQQTTTGAIGPTGELQKTVRLILGGSIAPTGDVTTSGGTPVTPAEPSGEAGGGRWTPYDPWEPGARRTDRNLDGEIRPTGQLIPTVIRGKPKDPVPLFPDVVEPPDGPVVVSPEDAVAVLPPIRLVPRRNRRTERVAREATPEPRPITTGPSRDIQRLEPPVTPTEPAAPEVASEPLDVTPVWPPARRVGVPVIAEAAEPVVLEEAFVSTTRLPLYTREELMALGRRMRVGSRAPASARLTPPSPANRTTSQSEGESGGAIPVGSGRPAPGRPGNGRPRERPRRD